MTNERTTGDGARDDDEHRSDIYNHAGGNGESHGHADGNGHSHGPTGGPASDHWYDRLQYWAAEWFYGLYHGMVEAHAFEKIEKEAEDIEDEFLFACFADAFGIPSPVSYYTVELLPYLADEFEQWERRMWDRESLLERKGQQYHFH